MPARRALYSDDQPRDDHGRWGEGSGVTHDPQLLKAAVRESIMFGFGAHGQVSRLGDKYRITSRNGKVVADGFKSEKDARDWARANKWGTVSSVGPAAHDPEDDDPMRDLAIFRSLAIAPSAPSAKPYWSELDGRRHLVVPTVALLGDIVVRPMNSEVAEFVPASALAANPGDWDGCPILWHHPEDGRALAGGDAALQAKYAFGVMRSTRYANGALQTEAWLDPQAAARIGPEATDRVKRCADGEGLADVSIGAMIEFDQLAGKHGDKEYGITWRSVKPDHLAILPAGLPGACSVAAGCGAPRAMASGDRALYSPDQPRDDHGRFGEGDWVKFNGNSADGKIVGGSFHAVVVNPHSNADKVASTKGGRMYEKNGGRHLPTATLRWERSRMKADGTVETTSKTFEAYHHTMGAPDSRYSNDVNKRTMGGKMTKLDRVLRALGLRGDDAAPEVDEKLSAALLANDAEFNGVVELSDTHVVYVSGDRLLSQEYEPVTKDGEPAGFVLVNTAREVEPVTRYEPLAAEADPLSDVTVEDCERMVAQLAVALAGKRHSAGDEQMIQAVHDHAVGLGAQCAYMKMAAAESKRFLTRAEIEQARQEPFGLGRVLRSDVRKVNRRATTAGEDEGE